MPNALPDWLDECERILARTPPRDQSATQERQCVDTGAKPATALPKGRVASPTLPGSAERAVPDMTDLRQDLNRRVAAFKSQQQSLRAAREADYADAIARIRSVTAGWAPPAVESPPMVVTCAAIPAPTTDVDTGWERIWLSIMKVADGAPASGVPDDR